MPQTASFARPAYVALQGQKLDEDYRGPRYADDPKAREAALARLQVKNLKREGVRRRPAQS